ncbi:MAG: VWA domain-containing protein [Bacteroidetes bacterium]|nr:MAG: VWA domain-containing protein [Bacteroidota bacterium]
MSRKQLALSSSFVLALLVLLSACQNRQVGYAEHQYAPAPRMVMKDMEAPLPAGEMAEPMPGMDAGEGAEDFNREEYDRIYENAFLSPKVNPLSTFAIDVDAASYANVRRFLNESRMPYPDAVRIEEMINYFDYDYPQPEGSDPFSITTELGVCPWNQEHYLVHIGLQGKDLPAADLPPSNLVFLFDVSGSMDDPNKLPLLKSAFRLLVEQLDEKDRVAIVVYAGAAGVVLPSTRGDQQAEILAALEDLSAGGSTAGGEGIQLAYKIAQEHFIPDGNNRIILATDGDFNVGPSSQGELVRMIEEKREEGVFLSVLGFGTGNYQDSKMEQLSNKGNGNYAYIDNILEAKKVLVSEMGGTLFTIAKDVKIQVEFNPAIVKGYRLIGYENRLLAAEDFNDDTKDAGELGAGHSVTAIYEVVPVGASTKIRGIDSLKFSVTVPVDGSQQDLLFVKFRYKDPDGDVSKLIEQSLAATVTPLVRTSDNFRFSAAVAAFGMLLRNSDYKGESTYAMVKELATNAKGDDPNGYRSEFLQLVEKASLLDDRDLNAEGK